MAIRDRAQEKDHDHDRAMRCDAMRCDAMPQEKARLTGRCDAAGKGTSGSESRTAIAAELRSRWLTELAVVRSHLPHTTLMRETTSRIWRYET